MVQSESGPGVVFTLNAFFKKSSPANWFTKDFDFADLITGLENLFRGNKTFFHEFLFQQEAKSGTLSRAVIILDKIERLKTLQVLSQTGLFNNKSIPVIAIARKEHLARWKDWKEWRVKANFQELPVPCLWGGKPNYIQEIAEILFDLPGMQDSEAKENFEAFSKYLAYVGRGARGNVLLELQELKYYLEKDGTLYLRLNSLPYKNTIKHHTMMQDLLEKYEGQILPGFVEKDRPRIGVYYLLDWIADDDNLTFTKQDLLQAAGDRLITVSDKQEVREHVVENLLDALKQCGYLSFNGTQYQRKWPDADTKEYSYGADQNPPPPPPPPSLTPEQQNVWGEINEFNALIRLAGFKQQWRIPDETSEITVDREGGISNSLYIALEDGLRHIKDVTRLEMIQHHLKSARNRINEHRRLVDELKVQLITATGLPAAQIKMQIEDSEKERNKVLEEIKVIFQEIVHRSIVVVIMEE